jgi:glycerophosphoryl diester phosphodiesterase
MKVLLFSGFLLSVIQVQSQYLPKFDLQGHRGARGMKPENTIPSFLAALDSGVTTIELDVVITKDKQVLVSHEPFMSPTICLDSSGNEFKEERKFSIYKLTYEEIKIFDCGSKGHTGFPEQEKSAAHKPLLRDVIVAVENHIKNYTKYEVDYNIEIKSTPDGDKKNHPPIEEFSDLVFGVVDQYLPWQRVVIQSFDFRVLRYWHTKYPKVRLAMLIENVKSVDSNLTELGFKPSTYSPYYKLLKEQQVEYLHSLSVDGAEKPKTKMRVIPWTINDPDEMIKFKEMGVDGIITDYPNRAAQIGLSLPPKQ